MAPLPSQGERAPTSRPQLRCLHPACFRNGTVQYSSDAQGPSRILHCFSAERVFTRLFMHGVDGRQVLLCLKGNRKGNGHVAAD